MSLPVRAGQTLYVPGGTLHSFGPGTVVYEIEQTSDIQQHAMRHRMEDGSPITEQKWHANLERLLDEWRPEPRPDFQSGLGVQVDDGVERTVLCAGPHFALERWRIATAAPMVHEFPSALVLSNAGPPVTVATPGGRERLARAESLLLPAALGRLRIEGPSDVLLGYLPDLDLDVRAPCWPPATGPRRSQPSAKGSDHPGKTTNRRATPQQPSACA